jgi:radical SAM protein (TIGR01212 family)
MSKLPQYKTNQYKNSDSNKRYYTYDYYLRQKFGSKCRKIPLDAGFTCPNIDGKCGYGGCIYCSPRGSGDFACLPDISITEQYEQQKKLITKWQTGKCIAYLQAHTNTYAPIDELRRVYNEALALPDAVALNIATRADCLEGDVLSLLAEIAEKTVLTVELGLQSSSDKTAEFIRRGHDFNQFCTGYTALREISDKISICIHIINGLPNENREDMINTARDCAVLRPDQIKIHLLHVLKNTALEQLYRKGEYTPMTLDDYVGTVCDQLEILPYDTVIGRLTGDGLGDDLLAPDWSRKKLIVLNSIDKELYRRQSWQGKKANI